MLLMSERAANSVCSPPPCGDGLARVGFDAQSSDPTLHRGLLGSVLVDATANNYDPPPHPSPTRGGGSRTSKWRGNGSTPSVREP